MKYLLFFSFLFLPLYSIAQNENLKHDNIWLTGYANAPGNPCFGGTVIDFSADTLDIYYEYRDMDFDFASISMCDENGELIFSSNNYYIANKLNEVMENGEDLNPDNTSMPQDRKQQAIIALPSPANDSTYYLIHQESTWHGDLDGNITGVFLLHQTKVDMKCCGDNPLGIVEFKNIPILEDTLHYGRITATRHANGRDWWIIQQKFASNKYYKFLLTPQGIEAQESQEIGEFPIFSTGSGQATFSPDGSKYVTTNTYGLNHDSSVDIFDFDRCSGLFSNPRRIPLSSSYLRGAAISPNSRYLYLSYAIDFYQVDLDAEILDTLLVEEYDGFEGPLPTYPFVAQLGPDNKIYLSAWNGNKVLHVIHNPDEAGVACNLEQHGIELPSYNSGTVPNHPDYRLGRLIGSPCDTLEWIEDTTSVNILLEENRTIFLFPNPASSQLTINHSALNQSGKVLIYDARGELVKQVLAQTNATQTTIRIPNLPTGIYWVQLLLSDGTKSTTRVSVIK